MSNKVYGIPVRDWIEMTIKASASLLEFAKTTVCPVFQNKKNRSHFEAAVTTTYNRMVLWLGDSVVTKEPIRIQIASTCARSMFEHLIDLKWLTLTPQSAEAFLSFTIVRRFDMADKILKRVPAKSLYGRKAIPGGDSIGDPPKVANHARQLMPSAWLAQEERPTHNAQTLVGREQRAEGACCGPKRT
jgi:hypothetical protein